MTEPAQNCQCSHMDTQIFNIGLSVTATSAYIIVAHLLDNSVRPTLSEIKARWNASAEELDAAAAELLRRKVLERHPGAAPDDPIYICNPASMWVI